jgi:hypothetical protein
VFAVGAAAYFGFQNGTEMSVSFTCVFVGEAEIPSQKPGKGDVPAVDVSTSILRDSRP